MIKKIGGLGAVCAGCGKKLLPHAKFCHGCGHRVTIPRAKKMTTRRKIAGAALITAAVVIGILFVYWQISKPRAPSAVYSYGYGAAGAIEDAQVSNGGQNSVFVTVRNTGDRGATFQIELSSWAGTVVRDVYLPAGGSEGLAFDVTQVQGGNLTISLYVNGAFLDRKVVSATSAPQQQTDQPQNNAQIAPQISGAITNVQVPSSVDENQATTASVTVNNTGNTNATFQVKLAYSAGTISREVQVPKDDSRVVMFDLTPRRGDSNVAVSLYSGSTLLDQKSVAMTVLYVSGTITGIQVPATVEEGATESVSVTVKNTGNKSATFCVQLSSGSSTISDQVYLQEGNSGIVTLQWHPLRNESNVSISLYVSQTLLDSDTRNVTVLYTQLNMTQAVSWEWEKDENDLPAVTASANFTVVNDGTAAARNVSLTLYVEGVLRGNLGTISYLGPGRAYCGDWSTPLICEYRYVEGVPLIKRYYGNVQLKADWQSSSTTDNRSFNVPLSRSSYYTPGYINRFVTPDDPYIQNLAQHIVNNKSWYDPEWKAIKDWISSHITYAYDSVVHGGDYAQLPRETAMLGHGDCEDYAILMVSLLRARGYSTKDVYVALGKAANEIGGHAYVFRYTGLFWKVHEPQVGGWFEGTIADLWTWWHYDETAFFNDANYTRSIDEKPISVLNGNWIINNQQVTYCSLGNSVNASATITLSPQWRLAGGTLTIEVWKNISWRPDERYAQCSFSITLSEGESQTVSFTWSPNQASGTGGGILGGDLAGYCMRVLFDGEEIWVMSDSFPPSLYVGSSVYTPTSTEVTGSWLTYNEGNIDSTSVSGQKYITPQDSLVIKYAGRLPAKPTVDDLPELESIYEFVRDHWRCAYDSDQYGTGDYWAYPHEVLRQYERNNVMRGDCEDVAFLTASLYEASGVSSGNIRVVCGTIPNAGGHIHAEIAITRNGVKYWIPLEPGWGAEFLTYANSQHPMQRYLAWNDVYVWQGV